MRDDASFMEALEALEIERRLYVVEACASRAVQFYGTVTELDYEWLYEGINLVLTAHAGMEVADEARERRVWFERLLSRYPGEPEVGEREAVGVVCAALEALEAGVSASACGAMVSRALGLAGVVGGERGRAVEHQFISGLVACLGHDPGAPFAKARLEAVGWWDGDGCPEPEWR